MNVLLPSNKTQFYGQFENAGQVSTELCYPSVGRTGLIEHWVFEKLYFTYSVKNKAIPHTVGKAGLNEYEVPVKLNFTDSLKNKFVLPGIKKICHPSVGKTGMNEH